MRVLITSFSGIGHVHPMIPLAHALVARGHDIRWATGAELCPALERVGFEAVPVGVERAFDDFWHRHPEARALPRRDVPNVMFPGLFGEVAAPAALADLLPLALSWRPDLVVNDAAELAGPIAASVVGAPHATHSFGALTPAHRVAAASDLVAPLWSANGLEPRPYCGLYDHLYLDIYPPSMQPWGDNAHVGVRQLTRPVPVEEGAKPGVSWTRCDEPLVYLTFGTVFVGNPAFEAAVEALAAMDIRLVVTIGPAGDPDALGPLPNNVVVSRYIPQMQILPACDLVVSHAGSGTALATLGLGVPQLCLPQGADQFLNADAIVAAGAGLSLEPESADPESVANAAHRVLHESSFGLEARRVAEEIAGMPSPDEVAASLEALV